MNGKPKRLQTLTIHSCNKDIRPMVCKEQITNFSANSSNSKPFAKIQKFGLAKSNNLQTWSRTYQRPQQPIRLPRHEIFPDPLQIVQCKIQQLYRLKKWQSGQFLSKFSSTYRRQSINFKTTCPVRRCKIRPTRNGRTRRNLNFNHG